MFGFELAYVVFWLILYTVPWDIANFRCHKNRWSIAVVNVLLGWTFIGWVAALAWAFSENTDKNKYEAKKTSWWGY
jgi:hypothetical protein